MPRQTTHYLVLGYLLPSPAVLQAKQRKRKQHSAHQNLQQEVAYAEKSCSAMHWRPSLMCCKSEPAWLRIQSLPGFRADSAREAESIPWLLMELFVTL